jgi:hypothetical protein
MLARAGGRAASRLALFERARRIDGRIFSRSVSAERAGIEPLAGGFCKGASGVQRRIRSGTGVRQAMDDCDGMTRRTALTLLGGAAMAGPLEAGGPGPWYERMRRCGQTNFNEQDLAGYDVEAWMDYWTSLKVDALLINGGGIVAFYPTKVPYHHRSRYLGSRDLFGDFAKACKARNIRLVARMDCNYVYEDAAKAHPEWIERLAGGSPVTHPQSPWLFKTCMYSSYFTGQMPAIYREMNSLYEVDGFFTNGWPGVNRPGPCHCEACQGAPEAGTPEFLERHRERVIEIWNLWSAIAREKSPANVYVGNLGGGIRAVLDLKQIAGVAHWFNADHQGRSGVTPVWDCAQQGRVARSVMLGRTATNVTGAYANTQPLWRHASKAPEEMTMWLAQTAASGMTPWFHWLGGKPEDNRWRETGREFFTWLEVNERHFVNRAPLANLAVVFSQRMNAYYRAPGGGDAAEYLQGMYQTLLDGRFLFDFVHEDSLDAASLSKYDALVLPNCALLSNLQCDQIRGFAARGGSILATFETSFYDEKGFARATPGLADLFGITPDGGVVPPDGNAAYARIERRHPILDGFSRTAILPFAEYYRPLKAAAGAPATVIPPYPAFPPEMVYPRTARTTEPAAVVREQGESRLVFLPGDVCRSYWRSQNPDLSRLLKNSIRWMLPHQAVEVAGDGLVEIFAWKTDAGYAIHLLNYTNPDAMRGWFTQNYATGPQKVRVRLPAGSKLSRARLLRAGVDVNLGQPGEAVEFTVPEVRGYEVVALS